MNAAEATRGRELGRKPPRVCVLTLNWNGRPWVEDCVESVLRSDYSNYEVVVIDNGSSDGSPERVRRRFPQVKVIENGENLGYSRGFNVGLDYGFREVGADYCLVMNNDTILDGRAVRALVAAAEAVPRAGFTTGKVYYFDQPDVLQTVGKHEDAVVWNGSHIGHKERDAGQHDEPAERCFADDIFTLVRREMFEETGGYDPTFFLQCEEYDWQARAKKLGWKILYTPEARLWHKESMSLGKTSPRKAFYDARNPMIVIMRHRPPEFFRRYFRQHLRRVGWDVVRHSARFRWSHALANARGLASGVWWGLKQGKLTVRHFV